MKRLFELVALHRWTTIGAVLAITAVAALQIRHVEIRISAESMLEKGTPFWDYLVNAESKFGDQENVILILGDAALFDGDNIERIRLLVTRLSDIPGVSRTSSLFNVRNLKAIDGTIHAKPFLPAAPGSSPGARETLIADALGNPLVAGNLISEDGQTIAINIHTENRQNDAQFDRAITDAVESLISPLRTHLKTVYQVSSASLRSELTEQIRTDQRIFLPASILVLLTTLAISLRRLTAALIPLVTAGISVIWTLGFMGWMGIPLNIMTSIVPALVVIIGSTEDIHLLAEYAAGVRTHRSRREAISWMGQNMGVAILLTFITTYLGFLSISLNDIELLYQFGLIASTGLLFNFLVTVTLVPAMLSLFGHRRSSTGKFRRRQVWIQNVAIALVQFSLRYRLSVLLIAGALAIVAIGMASQLRINNNLLDYVDPASELRRNIERTHQEIAGIHSFSIIVESGIDNTFQQVRYLEELRKIQAHLATQAEFDRSFSIADFIALIDRVMSDDDDQENRAALVLPESDDIVREYLSFIRHDDIVGFVSDNFDSARILVRHNISSSQQLNAALRELEEYIQNHSDRALTIGVTGKSVLSNKAIEQMAYGQLQSLFLVGAAIVTLVSMLFISLRAGLIALLPNLFPVVFLFAVMALYGIPFNAGTSMVAVIALGICVDDTMHVMSRFHEELKRHDDRNTALEAMIRSESVPIFSTSLALAAGFSVLALSSFAPMVHFGLLSAMVILTALITTFVLTPLLLASGKLLTVWDLLSYRVQKEALLKAPLFEGMYVWQIKQILLSSEVRHIKKGERIIQQGTPGTEMFVILEGAVEVTLEAKDATPMRLRTIHVGQLFGEVAPLSGGSRTSDVTAITECQLLVLSWRRMEKLTRLHPRIAFRLFRNLTRITGSRLRHTTEYAGSERPSGSG